MNKSVRIVLSAAALAAAGAAAWWAYAKIQSSGSKVVYSTAKVERADMRSAISATGTIEPEELVNVGAQVGGMITELGTDAAGHTVDYCSEVKTGMMLAKIDDALYSAAVKNNEAAAEQAKASVANAKANIEVAAAKLELALANWRRAEKLNPQSVIAKSDYDSAKADYASALAEIKVREAELLRCQAAQSAAEAALDSADWNYKYCTIKSPVDGVIIDRRINVGQTVNSSMSAPSLFLIAKDLKRMEVWVSVNEADIGQITVGQPAEFKVDAFPGRVFKGEVRKIRMNATMSQNVVTYVAEVFTDNSDGTLLPYLTANVDFILEQRDNVLTVPNSALRFVPDAVQTATPAVAESSESPDAERRVLWTLDGGKLKPLTVTVGLNDGVRTEILDGAAENTPVVIGASVVETADGDDAGAAAGSPFLPKPPSHFGSKKK
ncbi:MAG: efflux RND transporter periplasmic adaptor subunit [Victivallaceae bacterium]|nr:efflux RND transporter periplasmic adaptor subunit [Victivallaceae bacterium]